MSSAQINFKLEDYVKQENMQKHDENPNSSALTLQLKVIDGFSVTSERIYRSDTNELKFLLLPDANKFPLNLNERQIACQDHDDDDDHHAEYLDKMLHFIRHHQDELINGSELLANVVTQGNVLETLLRTLYIKRNWSILGSKYQNTLYLCLNQAEMTPAELERERLQRAMETNLKQLLYSATPDGQPPTVRSAGGEFHGVFMCSIGEFRVIYATVMGGHQFEHLDQSNEAASSFVECKVMQSSQLKPEPEEALIWWSECCLKDVKEIYLARAETSGYVHSLDTCSLSTLVQDNINNWSSELCISFMYCMLLQLSSIMQLDSANAVYQFDYNASQGILNVSLSPERNEQTFISDWYRLMLEKP